MSARHKSCRHTSVRRSGSLSVCLPACPGLPACLSVCLCPFCMRHTPRARRDSSSCPTFNIPPNRYATFGAPASPLSFAPPHRGAAAPLAMTPSVRRPLTFRAAPAHRTLLPCRDSSIPRVLLPHRNGTVFRPSVSDICLCEAQRVHSS